MSSDPPSGVQRSTRVLLTRLLKDHVRPHLGRLALAIGCMVITAGSTALLARLMEPAFDGVFIRKDRELLLLVPLALLVVTLIKGAATYGESVLMVWVGQRIISDLQKKLFGRLLRLDLAFFHASGTGRLIARLINDVNMMRDSVSRVLTGIAKDALTLLFLVAVMFDTDWRLALIAFVVFPLAVFPIARIGRRMRKIISGQLEEIGHYMARLSEAFSGIRHVKAYNRELYEQARTDALVERVFRIIAKASRVRSLTGPVMETLGGLAIAAIILYGGYQIIAGVTTPGELSAFVTALLLAYRPAKNLANLNTNLQEGMAAAQRVFDLMDREPEIRDRTDARPLGVTGGAIRFDRVSFAYDEVPALHEVSFEIAAGKRVALVGPSGAGKSTILSLIPRFYDVAQGRVSIDGQDVREVTLESLREALALVSQEPFLFDDTIRANIAYGRLEASTEAIEAAARAAAAHDFIVNLPQGYDTTIGERGVKLSGGQRQRIAIARAMLKNAPILLLDEATSELDSESEHQVQQALLKLMEGRTTLVIAHRLSTVIGAERIYVVEEGRVIESGTHAELLARGGAYARLYRLQFAEDGLRAKRAATARA